MTHDSVRVIRLCGKYNYTSDIGDDVVRGAILLLCVGLLIWGVVWALSWADGLAAVIR